MRRTIQRWTTNAPLKVATAVAAILILVVGALTVALISLNTSHTAEDKAARVAGAAQDLANCINDVLGDRQSINDAPALIEQADASADWADSLVRVVTEPKPSTTAEVAAQMREFLDALDTYAAHLAHAKQVLHEHQAYRDAHPLGKC